ncbi:hypothetical protein H9Y04_40790 [Streptomyces sp. TRM66268-LWL]|uniref:Uncharacterized protein n=2 Tax=Streptomyces polyasparticus TaxID=2767826 RepID=A0ABR7SW65_9ACTN|nr:hypothetical protein [Streptomyces polyasparticus]
MSWGSGSARPAHVPAASTATIVLADGAHLDAVAASGLIGPGTLVFAPDTGAPPRHPQQVGYTGSLTEPGADFCLGEDFYLQTQDYASSAYITVLGPTLVRLFTLDDFAAFLGDADRAFAEGVFPAFLTTPSVLLADTSALGSPGAVDGPTLRLYVDHDGAISLSPGGTALGQAGDDLTTLTQRFDRINAVSEAPCAVTLGAVLPEEARTAALLVRPYLGRYLAAVKALRVLTAQNVLGLQVSGFGGRLTAGLAAAGAEADLLDAELPLVLSTAQQAYVAAADGRIFTVNHTVAAAVECLLAAGDHADQFTDPHVLDQVRSFFAARDVPLGVPAFHPADDTRLPIGAR